MSTAPTPLDTPPACPLCGATGPVLHHPRVFGLPGARVWRCSGCGAAFLHPYLDEAQLAAFYADYNAYTVDRAMFAAPPQAAQVFEYGAAEGRERVQLLRHQVAGKRILEVGCGAGCFLTPARRLALSVAGVEPNPDNRAFAAQASGATVWPDLAAVEGRFHAVFLFHVLEHITDPVAFLTRLRGLLTGRGVLVLELPNLDDALLSLYDLPAFRDFYFQKEHPYYYTANALKRLLVRAGWRVAWADARQRYGLANHLRWLKDGQPGGWRALQPLLAKADRPYRQALIRQGAADTLLLACRPNPG